FRVTSRRQTPSGVWDPTIYDGLALYHGEADPDLVAILADVDGLRRTLLVGVADEHARRERDGVVTGELAGRDRMALLLDRSPASTFTLEGAVYDPDAGQLNYHESFVGAVQRVCAAAGVPVRVGSVIDYKLGSSVVVSPDRTFAQALTELLAPLRWSERYKVDAWWEDDHLHIGPRSDPLGTVPVDAARIVEARVAKDWALPPGDVRVEGFTYQREVPDLPAGDTPTPGLPWTTGYEYVAPERRVSLTVQGKTESYTVQEIEYYNARGQLRGTYKRTQWHSKNRVDEMRSSIEFVEDPTSAAFGNKLREHETHYVRDVAYDANGQPVRNIDEVVRERRIEWDYYEDTGDVRRMDALEVYRDEAAGTSPLPLDKREITRQRFRRSMGQIWRDTEVVTFDEGGLIRRSVESREIGPFKLTVSAGSPSGAASAARPGYRMKTVAVASGPEDAPHVFSSSLIGDQASADAIRAQIAADGAVLRYRVTLTLAPDLRIRPGRTLQILNADSWWTVTSCYVYAVRMERSGGRAAMQVEGVAWA
ncbi:MAG: hypothetical protein QN174_13370, partial [Armatimonadota bacterium]|nr:hypothetical protein [Armatimonadota bacterium]